MSSLSHFVEGRDRLDPCVNEIHLYRYLIFILFFCPSLSPQFVEGWDWIVPVADRCTGIWGDVRLRRTGCIQLADPCAQTTLTPEALASLAQNAQTPVSAAIKSCVTVTNASAAAVLAGTQVTCFTGTQVQILTQKAELELHIEHVEAGGVVVVDVVATETVEV